MTIGFILNGEDVVIRADANSRLIDILRINFGLLGAKIGCLNGKCGFCSVIFNGMVSHACLIPAFLLRDSEIITIEGFSQTDEYQDIIKGFKKANMNDCGFCRTAKILSAGALLEKIKRPTEQEIINAFSGIKCRCSDQGKLIESIDYAAEIRQRRQHGRAG